MDGHGGLHNNSSTVQLQEARAVFCIKTDEMANATGVQAQ